MTFELGINYWPRRSAMWMWREFDIGEVRDDMAQIASIGFDVVRFFAMTRDFLPGPMCVDHEMVSRLVNARPLAASVRVHATLPRLQF